MPPHRGPPPSSPPPPPPPPPSQLNNSPGSLFRRWLGPAICILISIRISWYFIQPEDSANRLYARGGGSHGQANKYYFYNEITGQVCKIKQATLKLALLSTCLPKAWAADTDQAETTICAMSLCLGNLCLGNLLT